MCEPNQRWALGCTALNQSHHLSQPSQSIQASLDFGKMAAILVGDGWERRAGRITSSAVGIFWIPTFLHEDIRGYYNAELCIT